MQGRKITLPVLIVLFTTSFAFCQSEVIKPVVNSLAFYKLKKDLKYLGNAKKSIDSLIKTHADSLDLEKNVYRAVVNISIVYKDSLNTLKQPPNLFSQTVDLADKLAVWKKIYRFSDEMDYVNHCIADIYIRNGFNYMNTSDFVNASQQFAKAQKYAPGFKQLNFYIAYSNNKLGNLKDAVKYYNNLLAADSTRAEYFETTANIYQSMGDTAKALEIVKRGRKILPGDKLLLLNEANIYNNRQDYKSLEPLLSALLVIYPDNADVVFVAANCYDRLGMYNKAEPLYLQATDLASSAYEPAFNLGLLYFKEGIMNLPGKQQRLLLAAQTLEKANEISPNNTNCLQVLKLVYTESKNENQLIKINNKLKQLTNE